MMRGLAIVVLAAQSAVSPSLDVSSLTVSSPALVCELDMNQLRGEIRRLSLSPDGRNIHVRPRDRRCSTRLIVTMPDGVVSLAFGEPEAAAHGR
jgi:hypothetical protein